MKRPGPVGLVILFTLLIPFIIEFRTVLGFLGFEVAPSVYLPIAGVVLVVVFLVLWLLPERRREEPSKA